MTASFPRGEADLRTRAEQPPSERDAYLEKACGPDEDLRRDVESLLGYRDDAQAFFQNAAVDVFSQRPAAGAAVPEPDVDYTGRTLSHYDILEKIGEGGMGVVYRARDTRLDRLVALKVLPPEKVADPERLRRFVREAKAASALNHPNIVTIHDIDSADGITFIVMEHVKGTTLDQLIRRGPMPPKDTLAHAFQIADALSAAHGAGIVHRDVKPANIMVTDSGLVKILDFGLAKLNPAPAVPVSAPQARVTGRTEDGLIVGTVAYMSPEQAEGRDVDARSDIFSLGAVLYEMATGCRAFAGETHGPTLAAIVGEQPRAVRELAAGVPAEVELIITRCLEKDRDRRFQRASDVKAALERLLRQGPDAGVVRAGGRVVSARRRRLAWIAGAFLLATLSGLAAWRSGAWPPAEGLDPKVSALTVLPGSQVEPSLSPDGTHVAFVRDGDVHVQRIGDTTPQRLTDTPAQEHSPTWSPDAGRLAFLRVTPAGNEIVIVPSLSPGGAERRLLVANTASGSGLNDGERPCRTAAAKLFCGVAWSPDGRSLAVVDRESPQAPSSVFLVDVDTGERRRLTRPPAGFEDGLSAFSPDGRTLAFSRRSGWPLSDIYLLRLDDRGQPAGDPVRLTHDNAFIWGFDWAPDGRSLVFSSSRGGWTPCGGSLPPADHPRGSRSAATTPSTRRSPGGATGSLTATAGSTCTCGACRRRVPGARRTRRHRRRGSATRPSGISSRRSRPMGSVSRGLPPTRAATRSGRAARAVRHRSS